MTSLVGFLEEIEKLAYKLLLWVILIPKTIAKIVINPRWAAGYIKEELKEDSASPFDEYISPIVLLLAVALLPAIVVNFLPKFGMTVINPHDGFIEGRFVQVEVESIFKSYSYNAHTEFSWDLTKIQIDELGNYSYLSVYDEFHSDYDGTAFFQYIDQNRIKDAFSVEFTEPGEYYLSVFASRFHPERRYQPIESQYAEISILVPENPDEQIWVSKYDSTTFASDNFYVGTEASPGEGRATTEIVGEELKDEANILLALALMLPPLLFALATKLFTQHSISETALKESFYTQCYYFSPLSLAIWATYYANYYVTTDIFFYAGEQISRFIMFIPLGLALLWFIIVEINAIALERETTLDNSFFIVVVCVISILYTTNFFLSFTGKREVFRVGAIWSYPILTMVLLVSFILTRIGKRIKRKKS